MTGLRAINNLFKTVLLILGTCGFAIAGDDRTTVLRGDSGDNPIEIHLWVDDNFVESEPPHVVKHVQQGSIREEAETMRRFLQCLLLTVFAFIFGVLLFILYEKISYIPASKFNHKINLNTQLLNHYYVDFGGKYLNSSNKDILDKNGIPLYRVKGNYYYNPIRVIQYALGAYEYYLSTKDIGAQNIFLMCVDWLCDNLRKRERFFYWEYPFENTKFPGGLYRVPYFSAMAQGQGASVLIRALLITKDEKYLQLTQKAIEPIFFDISEGGISIVKDNNKFIFPEEYPTNPPSYILNGAIYAYWGVYDFYLVSGDQDIGRFHEIIVESLLYMIEKYDTGFWSLYSLWPGNLASPHYHSEHITQLKVLYLITGNKKFLRYSKKFKDYQNNWIHRSNYFFRSNLRRINSLVIGKKICESSNKPQG